MRRERIGKNILTVLFVLISISYMMPIVVVLFNSFICISHYYDPVQFHEKGDSDHHRRRIQPADCRFLCRY